MPGNLDCAALAGFGLALDFLVGSDLMFDWFSSCPICCKRPLAYIHCARKGLLSPLESRAVLICSTWAIMSSRDSRAWGFSATLNEYMVSFSATSQATW